MRKNWTLIVCSALYQAVFPVNSIPVVPPGAWWIAWTSEQIRTVSTGRQWFNTALIVAWHQAWGWCNGSCCHWTRHNWAARTDSFLSTGKYAFMDNNSPSCFLILNTWCGRSYHREGFLHLNLRGSRDHSLGCTVPVSQTSVFSGQVFPSWALEKEKESLGT